MENPNKDKRTIRIGKEVNEWIKRESSMKRISGNELIERIIKERMEEYGDRK